MRHIFITLLFIVPIVCLGQDVMVIAATVVNNETKEPVESVNIGFVGKGIGTISNAKGNFSLVFKLNAVEPSDILQISSIGYETKEITFKELDALTSYKVIIGLTPKNYTLEKVIVKGVPREKKILGHPDITAFNMGYWRNAEALGGEIASVIRVRKYNTRLLNLKFNIIENLSDSIKVRVNVYDFKRGTPGKNLLTQNIFHTISKKKGLETIDLKPYGITVNDDIAISLELIEIYGTAIYFAISASAYGGQSFTREISQDDWKIYKKVGIGFSLDSSYPVKGANKEIDTRPKPETISLLWDTSLNLQNRNTKEELKLLKKYITSLDNVKVVVSKFNNKIYDSETFPCYKGRCDELFSYLRHSDYHGASNYETLLQDPKNDASVILLFSDGKSFYGPPKTKINVPTFAVNSIQKAEHKGLQDLSVNSGAAYLDLTRLNQKMALDFLLYDINDLATYKEKEAQTVNDYYYGVVYHTDSIPVDGARIRVEGQLEEVFSKSNGSYKIEANAGDILEIEALGMYDEKVQLGSFKKVHIPMKVNREMLEEVLIQDRKEQKALVVTPFGKRNPDGIGYSMEKTITSEDINPSYTELKQVLNLGVGLDAIGIDPFGGVKYRFSKFRFASFGRSSFAAVVVDDIVYDQNIPGTRVPVINPQQINRIILLSTALSTVRYGSAAAYGAIVIETKDYVKNFQEDEEKEASSALAKGNDYVEKIMTVEQATTALSGPNYLEQLEASTTFDSAKKSYFKSLDRNKNSIAFYMIAANYFEKWDANFAQVIRSNILSIAPTNTKALKVLAYQLEKHGQIQEAQSIYEQILEIDPDSAQSYRDLAHIYVLNGAYAEAATLYRQMIYNTIPNVDFIDFQDVLLTEFQHLIKNHKSKIDFKGLPNEMLSLDFKRDIRLVLEWNAPGTEFDVQFVNPENKFYSFSHTFFNNKELLKQEVADGIHMKEFIIDDDTAGRWLINIKYEGPDEKTIPVVLKYTLYQNYGLPEETKTIKTVQLDQFQDKITLDSFLNSGN